MHYCLFVYLFVCLFICLFVCLFDSKVQKTKDHNQSYLSRSADRDIDAILVAP